MLPAAWLAIFIAVYAYCRSFLSFNYPFVEQFSFFRFSKEYAFSTLGQPGGLATYIADFLTQFYYYPEIGPLISAVLAVLLTVLMDLNLKKLSPRYYFPFLSAIPALACLWIETDFNYYLSGTVSLILGLVTFGIYQKSMRYLSFYTRIFLLILLSWPLDFLLGPNALLTIALCVIVELKKSQPRSLVSFLAVPVAVACPIVLYYAEIGKDLRFQLLPDGYYVEILSTPLHCYYPWIAVGLNVVLAKILTVFPLSSDLGKKSLLGRLTNNVLVVGLQLVGVVTLMHWGVHQYHSATNYEAKVFDYYCRTGEWTKLLQDKHLRASKNFMHTCYQNLALSSLNLMGDKLFAYPQLGFPGIILKWNKTVNSSILLSDIYWQAGDVAIAQEMAFEGMIASRNGITPRLLMRLVQTNLVTGNYAVAEKYITLLSDTYTYSAEAEKYRKMLYNDQAVFNDAELGARKRAMNNAPGLTHAENIVEDLKYIMENNPTYIPAFHYYGCICLLIKDIPSFIQFIDKFKDASALTHMPIHFQEALILAFEQESERWADLGVTPQVKARYEQYRTIFLKHRGSPVLEHKMASLFGDTYWYYFMFKK